MVGWRREVSRVAAGYIQWMRFGAFGDTDVLLCFCLPGIQKVDKTEIVPGGADAQASLKEVLADFILRGALRNCFKTKHVPNRFGIMDILQTGHGSEATAAANQSRIK